MDEELDVTDHANDSHDEAPQERLRPRIDAAPPRRWPRVLGLVFLGTLLCGLGAILIAGFVKGQQDAAIEAEREGAIKPPLRVKLQPHGEPVVTFDVATPWRPAPKGTLMSRLPETWKPGEVGVVSPTVPLRCTR